MVWYLSRKPFPGSTENFSLSISNNEVLLGRGRDCTCLCLSMYVSRHHVKIRPRGDGGLCLIDLGSSNGTFINSRKVFPNTEEVLSVGDEVGIGNIVANSADCFVFIVSKDQPLGLSAPRQEELSLGLPVNLRVTLHRILPYRHSTHTKKQLT